MATRRPPRPGTNPPPKRREDNFWYVVMVLAIVSFTLSFWIFYALTSRVNTKTPTVATQPSADSSPAPGTSEPTDTSMPTLLIGEGQGGESAPPVVVTPTPRPTASVEATLPVEPTPAASPSLSGIISFASPTPRATATPRARASAAADSALQEVTPTPKPEAAKPESQPEVVYRVQVGSYAEREDAAKAAEELAGMGYSVVMIGDGDRTRIQLGSFGEQDKALRLAEEITAKGYSVVVRRTSR